MSSRVVDVYRLAGLPFELGRLNVPRIGRDVEWEHLNRLVTSTSESMSPTIGVLLGTYGAGKTFLLWNLARSYEPSKTSHVLSFGPIRLIDPEQKRDFTRGLVTRLFARGIDIEGQLVPLLAGISAKKLTMPAGIRPYADLLRALARPESAQIARRVLTGGRALRKEAEEAKILETPQIRTNDDAIFLLQALQILARAAGVKSLVLLVDEVEYIDALSPALKASVIDSLKHLWDQEVDFFSREVAASPLLMLLSATPSFWQQMKMQISDARKGHTGVVGIVPFFARISPVDVIEMTQELSEDEARNLIISRMNMVRPGQKKEDLIPFTTDYVDYVYHLSQGLPRRIIEICQVVLQEAAQHNLKKIDATQAKKILRELLISYEPIKTE